MSAQDKPISERLTEVVTSANTLTNTVQNKVNDIDAKVSKATEQLNTDLQAAETKFNEWKDTLVENVNGLEVFRRGITKEFSFTSFLSPGSYSADASGPQKDFPMCATPKDPYYVNLIEFDASKIGHFGAGGESFTAEFKMDHRGMLSSASYGDHIIIHGTASSDCVSGHIEVRNISKDHVIKVFISEPNQIAHEIPLDKALVGSTIPVAFRAINQGRGKGIARVTLKIDTRYHCGASRSVGVDCKYSSISGQPSANRISHIQPSWEK